MGSVFPSCLSELQCSPILLLESLFLRRRWPVISSELQGRSLQMDSSARGIGQQ